MNYIGNSHCSKESKKNQNDADHHFTFSGLLYLKRQEEKVLTT